MARQHIHVEMDTELVAAIWHYAQDHPIATALGRKSLTFTDALSLVSRKGLASEGVQIDSEDQPQEQEIQR